MGLKYSGSNDPEVNEKVDEIIGQITYEILSHLNPKSIILTGSFGRGEGTLIEKNGKLKFLSDCEIILILRRYILRDTFEKVKKLSTDISQKTGLEVSISGAILSTYSLFPVLFRTLKPTIGNYDLKYGSRLIYGKDYLRKIPYFKAEDIPLWEGIRLIFNRMAESLNYFSIDSLEEGKAVFWANKIILACQDALLLSIGRYHHSYKTRNAMLQDLLPQYFSELNEEFPHFLTLTIRATEWKLQGRYPDKLDADEFWFDVTEICNKVFRYIIEKDMGIKFDTYLDFQEKYLKHPKVKRKYHSFLLSSLIYQNLLTGVKMVLNGTRKLMPIKITTRIRTPWTHTIYSMIPLIYFSISRGGEINRLYLERARETLSQFKELKEPELSPPKEFDYLKKEAINLWHAVCY